MDRQDEMLNTVAEFSDSAIGFDNDEFNVDIRIRVNDCDKATAETELKRAYENWMYQECENSILIDKDTTQDDLLQMPIGDYMLACLEKKGISFETTDGKQNEMPRLNSLGISPIPKSNNDMSKTGHVSITDSIIKQPMKKTAQKVISQNERNER